MGKLMAAGLLQHCTEGDGGATRWRFRAHANDGKRILQGLQGWRYHRATGHINGDPRDRPGGCFQEILLGESSRFLSDSVLVLPRLVSECECTHLIAATDDNLAADEWSGVTLRRVQCHSDGVNLDGRSHALSSIILARVLWYLEKLEPALTVDIFGSSGRTVDLADMCFSFSGQEPMLNRYTEGGEFSPHEDSAMPRTHRLPHTAHVCDRHAYRVCQIMRSPSWCR